MFKTTSLIIIAAIILPLAMLAQTPKAYSGTIERIESFPSAFVSSRNIDVWLPPNYSTKNKYAVVYMHDGQMLFDSTITWNKQEWMVDETLTNLLKTNTIQPCIVVGIANAGAYRHADYFPAKALNYMPTSLKDSIITDELKQKANADKYLRFLVEELKPYIDRKYSTLTNASNTIIAGSSMGGLISMYAICEYPSIFGKAACISTHWIGSLKRLNNNIPNGFLQYLQSNMPSPTTHTLYFDYGMIGLDSLYKPHQVKATQLLQKAGYTNKNLLVQEFPTDDHSEKSWSKRLTIPFTFLLAKQ